VSVPAAFALPFRVAFVALMPVAAKVVATGRGGAATRATVCEAPLAEVATSNRSPGRSESDLTKTGTALWVLLLLPKRPDVLSPQLVRVPSAHRASEWEFPAATAVTVLPANTPDRSMVTGTMLGCVVLLPSWP
jgi:hypothetical protein